MDKKEQDRIIKGLVRQRLVEDELKWRAKPENHHDDELVRKMLLEINELGCNLEYLYDISSLKITDRGIVDIILKYLGAFTRIGTMQDVVCGIGYKENKYATEEIVKAFNGIIPRLNDYIYHLAGFDNAFNRLKDKRYIDDYIKWLADPDIATRMPFTMVMLARWKNMEARQLYLQYLSTDREDQIIFTSIRALQYYNDEESREKLIAMSKHQNQNISSAAEKVMKKLKI